VENWGKPANVVKGLRVHNDITRDLGKGNRGVIFLDAEAVIPKEGKNFNDVCHLSKKGKLMLMNAFMPAIEAFWKNKHGLPDNPPLQKPGRATTRWRRP
jgi:hypothetical protein